MTLAVRESKIAPLDVPGNATWTSSYGISDDAWTAYLAALDRAEDMAIALEIRVRTREASGRPVELDDFMREQGYDPADFQA